MDSSVRGLFVFSDGCRWGSDSHNDISSLYLILMDWEYLFLPSLSIDSNLLRYNDEGNGFQKLKGIPTISPLLNLARRNYPHLYEDWQVLSYENPSGEDFGSSIRIRSGKVRSLTFQPSNFNVQLKRLCYLLSEPDFRKKPVVESIDLSFGRSVFAKL